MSYNFNSKNVMVRGTGFHLSPMVFPDSSSASNTLNHKSSVL